MNIHRAYGCRDDSLPRLRPLAPDLTRATTFAYPSAEELRAVGAGERAGEFYARYGHPAGRAFESQVAALEGADGAVSFSSGMAAVHAIFCGLLRAARWPMNSASTSGRSEESGSSSRRSGVTRPFFGGAIWAVSRARRDLSHGGKRAART